MRRAAALAAGLLLSACSAVAPSLPDAREAAYLRAAQAQAVRIAAMSDEEVAAELARPEAGATQPVAMSRRPRMESLDHWLDLFGCRDRQTVALRAVCTADAARLHEAAEKLLREDAAPGALRT